MVIKIESIVNNTDNVKVGISEDQNIWTKFKNIENFGTLSREINITHQNVTFYFKIQQFKKKINIILAHN